MSEIHKSSFKNYLKQRSNDYRQYGRYMCSDMSMADMGTRFLSFLGDVVLMLFPIFLWDYIFLLTAAGYLSYGLFDVVRIVLDVLLCVSILCANTYLMVLFKGQTFGKAAMNLKVVALDNKELTNKVLITRELLGKAIPMLVVFLILEFIGINGLIGVLGFVVLNGICVLADKKHRSMIDFVLKTKVVLLNEKGKKSKFAPMAEKPKEKKIELSENNYDLHVYSSFSHDGEVEVEDLFKQAKLAGIETLSICDHNCAKANIVAKKVAPLYGITYVPGINIDCDYKGNNIRVLGYFIETNDDRFMQIEYENLAKEKAVSQRRIQLFEAFTGFHVNVDKILKSNRFQIISPEMIARQILSDSEYRKTKLLQPYLNGAKKDKPISFFIEDFFGKKGPAYVPIAHPNVVDMIALIKASGGVPVLAHPMRSFKQEPELIEEIIQLGIKGLEIFTPYHTHEDMRYLIPLAKKYHLDITAGSEYHGENKPKFILGQTYCPKDVESVVAKFVQKYIK